MNAPDETKVRVDLFAMWLRKEIDRCTLFDSRARSVVCASLHDAMRLYTGPLIEPTIPALALLPIDNQFRRYMAAAADTIAMARANTLTMATVYVLIGREAAQ